MIDPDDDKPVHILVVDEDEVDRAFIRGVLDRAEFHVEVIEASTAAEATSLAASTHFSCILMDYDLPDASGLGVVERLRGAEIRTPILVLTGHGSEDLAVDVMRAGATDYLPKDRISPAALAARVHAALRVGHAEERARRAVRALADERRLFRAVLEQMPGGVLVASVPDGAILLENPQAREILGEHFQWSTEELEGGSGSDVPDAGWPLIRALVAGEVVIDKEITLTREGDDPVHVSASAAPVVDDADERVAAVMTVHDVTREHDALARLERAKQAREDLLSIVSHDLRGPLNAIAIASEELGDPEIDHEDRQHYAAAIARAVGRANRLISDLLDVGRLDAGRFELSTTLIAPRTLVGRAVADHALLAEEKNVTLEAAGGAELAEVEADPDRLNQALSNLLSNALKHTPEGGRIEVRAESFEDRVRFTVEDTGRGIPAERLPDIFDRYVQGGKKRGGVGLGLAIVKGIAEAHDGSVGVSSEVGEGARFWLDIPTARSTIAK